MSAILGIVSQKGYDDMLKSSAFFISLLCLCLSGCVSEFQSSYPDVADSRSNATYVVTVGMEDSAFAGSCPGALLDARRMTALLSNYTANVKSFYNGDATKSAVRNAMIEAAEKADLFIFYYSGHGGQQRFYDTGPDEDDGMDEYLCLYDTYMRDNEVWEIISRCKGRVMFIADACHSCDIYRTQSPFLLSKSMPLSVTHNKTGPINLLVWAGCPADTYSYGSASGGKMTNTLLKYFHPNMTYEALWNYMENDSSLQKYEIIQRTVMGNGFVAKPVFR